MFGAKTRVGQIGEANALRSWEPAVARVEGRLSWHHQEDEAWLAVPHFRRRRVAHFRELMIDSVRGDPADRSCGHEPSTAMTRLSWWPAGLWPPTQVSCVVGNRRIRGCSNLQQARQTRDHCVQSVLAVKCQHTAGIAVFRRLRWSRPMLGVQEVVGSNPAGPTSLR